MIKNIPKGKNNKISINVILKNGSKSAKIKLLSSTFLEVSRQIFNGVTEPKELINVGKEFIGKNIPEKKIDNNEIIKLDISPILKIIIKEPEISPKAIKGIELKKNVSKTIKISKKLKSE